MPVIHPRRFVLLTNYWNREMSIDAINDEIRATRRRLAAQFDNNLSEIIEDLRGRQQTDGRTYITREPRLTERTTDEQTDPPTRDLNDSRDA
jgi:hypothetical protein